MPKSGSHPEMAEPRQRMPLPPFGQDREEFPIVAIGASAGGLEACKKLLSALPRSTGMAFVIVQHLDPGHESLLVDLLAVHTSMRVAQASDGMPIERETVYVIPPGVYLSVDDKRVLQLTRPTERHGARLPFDFLLKSLAAAFGERVVAIVMSGTGADGSDGLRAVKSAGGRTIAQVIAEADYDGMPRSAIATGAVDLVAPAARIASELIERERRGVETPRRDPSHPLSSIADLLPEIITLLRTKTVHDFSFYKHGTLERRVERRMAMAAVSSADGYLALLQRDARELDELSRDLLINVTSFFRDAQVFEHLATNVLPNLIQDHPPGRPLRVWVAGCSSGEETYSLAILFREQIIVSKREIKLQIFASDVDPDAVASARDGLYPSAIEASVSAARLAQFFTREDRSYRVSPDLRANVVCTVQDLLADPPFAHLDFVSCRNLLIYLKPEAQAKAIAIFHFALREGGLLLVGNAETVGLTDGQFDVVSKPERIYRRIGGNRPGEFSLSTIVGESQRARPRMDVLSAPSRQAALAELCRRHVQDSYGPAAVSGQFEAGMPPFSRPNGQVSESRLGPADTRLDGQGARGGTDQTQGGHPGCAEKRSALHCNGRIDHCWRRDQYFQHRGRADRRRWAGSAAGVLR